MTGNSMQQFISELNTINEEEQKVDKLPIGMMKVHTSDGLELCVSSVIWECYFPVDCSRINMALKDVKLLVKILHSDLSDKKVTDWVKE